MVSLPRRLVQGWGEGSPICGFQEKPGLCWEFGVGLCIGMVPPEHLFRGTGEFWRGR